MTPVLIALAIGLVVGYLGGGRLSRAGHAHLRALPLLVLGVALQAVGQHIGYGLIVMSYVALGAFAALNVNRTGMGLLLVGVLLNAAPILLDGGMPVEAHAVVSAGIVSARQVDQLSISGKRHLAHRGDHLRALDDTIPEWWTHEVMSFGDLVIAVGVAAVVAGLLQPARRVSVA